MIFDIVEGKPVITAEGVNIPEFKEIWKADKDRYKRLAQGTLAYVYHMCDPRSSYAKLPEDQREAVIIEDYIPEPNRRNGYNPPERVKKAMEKYLSLIETPNLRLLKSARNAVEKTAEYFNDVDYTKVNDVGDKEYTVRDVMTFFSKLKEMTQNLSALEKLVMEEIEINKSKIYGDHKPGLIEEFLKNERTDKH